MIAARTDEAKRDRRRAAAAKAPDLEIVHRRFWERAGRTEEAPRVELRQLQAMAVRIGPDSIAVGVLRIVELRRCA